MSLHKRIFFSGVSALPGRWLLQSPRIPVLLPYHHLVSNKALPHITGIYNYKNEQQFRTDLEWLLRVRKPLHPEELIRCIDEGRPLPARRFLLTFDDGLRAAAEVAAPILLQMGVPAVFFINPSFIDNRELFYRCKLSLIHEAVRKDKVKRKHLQALFNSPSCQLPLLRKELLRIHYPQRAEADRIGHELGIDFNSYLKQQQPFMSLAQVNALEHQGFSIGAHSMDHPHYGTIPLSEQIWQTEESLRWVAQHTQKKLQLFSFPHQDACVQQAFFAHFNQASPYKPLFFGTQNQKNEIHNRVLHRYNGEDPARKGAVMAKGVTMQYHLLHSFYNTLVKRKP